MLATASAGNAGAPGADGAALNIVPHERHPLNYLLEVTPATASTSYIALDVHRSVFVYCIAHCVHNDPLRTASLPQVRRPTQCDVASLSVSG